MSKFSAAALSVQPFVVAKNRDVEGKQGVFLLFLHL